MDQMNHPQDLIATQAFTNAARSATVRNIAFGGAAGIVALGASIAAIVWAANTGTDPEAIKAALAHMPPLKVEGTVRADGQVALADGGTVRLEEGGIVRLDPNASVKVDGKLQATPGPQVQLPQLKQDSDPAITTEVTVFKFVRHGEGSVATGWDYPSGNAKAPHAQFCYFTYRRPVDDVSIREDLYHRARVVQSPGVSDQEQAARLAKCQWHPALPAVNTPVVNASPFFRPVPPTKGVY